MIKRLGNFLILIGLLCLVIFFTSNTFLLDESWFFLGGLACTALGLLLRKGRKKKEKRKKRSRRSRSDSGENDDND